MWAGLGTALGLLVVSFLLDLGWPQRLAVLAVVVVIGLGALLWRHRGEIAAAGTTTGGATGPSDATGPADPDSSTPDTTPEGSTP